MGPPTEIPPTRRKRNFPRIALNRMSTWARALSPLATSLYAQQGGQCRSDRGHLRSIGLWADTCRYYIRNLSIEPSPSEIREVLTTGSSTYQELANECLRECATFLVPQEWKPWGRGFLTCISVPLVKCLVIIVSFF